MDLQKEAIEANKLGTYFQGVQFFNIVNLACGLKDLEWADYFMNKFAGKVNTPDKEDFIHLSKARIFIERKQYEEALVSLINIKSKLFQIEKVSNGTLINGVFLRSYFFFVQGEKRKRCLASVRLFNMN